MPESVLSIKNMTVTCDSDKTACEIVNSIETLLKDKGIPKTDYFLRWEVN